MESMTDDGIADSEADDSGAQSEHVSLVELVA